MLISTVQASEPSITEVGGKGHSLWCMRSMGLPVPPAVIIPTSVCRKFMKDPEKTMAGVEKLLPKIKKFFKAKQTLMSVRSSGVHSMPGMMDTILNVGLVTDGDDSNFDYWHAKLGYQCAKDCAKAQADGFYKALGQAVLNREFDTVDKQLLTAIEAVFRSWNSERAKTYRKLNGIDDSAGTAVVIQAMVFGNHNELSCTGVSFTRNPETGIHHFSGEFLVAAQGEVLVGGQQHGMPISELEHWNPKVASDLLSFGLTLETAKRYPQEIEFTVDDGKLWLLQTRALKPAAAAALRIALDMHGCGLVTAEEACRRVTRQQYAKAVLSTVAEDLAVPPAAVGVGASPGIATGVAVLTTEAAINCSEPCILVRDETSPDDLSGMAKAKGVLTMKGGITSHAAVVARSMNKPCVVGLGTSVEGIEGLLITIDGVTGKVYPGTVPVVAGDPLLREKFDELMFTALKAIPIECQTPCAAGRAVDVTDELAVSLNDAVMKVTATLAAHPGKLWVMASSSLASPNGTFYDMLGCEPNKGVQPVVDALPADLRERVSCGPICYTLHDLVLASGNDVVVAMEPHEAARKVLQWKAAEGCSFFTMGNFGFGTPMLSREQAVGELLK